MVTVVRPRSFIFYLTELEGEGSSRMIGHPYPLTFTKTNCPYVYSQHLETLDLTTPVLSRILLYLSLLCGKNNKDGTHPAVFCLDRQRITCVTVFTTNEIPCLLYQKIKKHATLSIFHRIYIAFQDEKKKCHKSQQKSIKWTK